jgi:hypothetical protein
MFDLEAWAGWLRSFDSAWLFLLILVVVVAAVGLWSKSLRSDKDRGSQGE